MRLRHWIKHGGVGRLHVLRRTEWEVVMERRRACLWVKTATHDGSLLWGGVGRMWARVGARGHAGVRHHVVGVSVLLEHGCLLLLRLTHHELLMMVLTHRHHLTGVCVRTWRNSGACTHRSLIGVMHCLLLRHVKVRRMRMRMHAHPARRPEPASTARVHARMRHTHVGVLRVKVHVARDGHARSPVGHVTRLTDVETVGTDVDVGWALTSHYGTRIR